MENVTKVDIIFFIFDIPVYIIYKFTDFLVIIIISDVPIINYSGEYVGVYILKCFGRRAHKLHELVSVHLHLFNKICSKLNLNEI